MIRVLGVSAPHYVKMENEIKSTSLNSSDPFSLYNAYKVCAYNAEYGDKDWGTSNWNTKTGRDNSILLLQYYQNDLPKFIQKLKEIRPNLLFIGTMSLGFAGAIELAKKAKEILGDKVFIVLGGKHIIETMYYYNNQVNQLKSSPLVLMNNKKIPKVFDMICSGDGEEILYEIGKAVNRCDEKGLPLNKVYEYNDFKKAKGNWLLGWLENDYYKYIVSNNEMLDYDSMPMTSELFNISTKFDIFDNCDLTAHTMSYMSKGCVHNCFYCSESSLINGKLCQVTTAPERLYNNLKSIEKVGKERYNSDKMSAFVEDSIILAGSPILLKRFADLLEENPINVEFGGQFTIDTLLNEKNKIQIERLSKLGFKYIFAGLETNNEKIASTMSKNRNSEKWVDKNEAAIQFMSSIGMKYGISVLFGLGESQEDRIRLMNDIKKWKETYGLPNCISMNLAVQHPLQNYDIYDYINWGTDIDSEYLPIIIELFGEASNRYKLPNVNFLSIDELLEIRKLYKEINSNENKKVLSMERSGY